MRIPIKMQLGSDKSPTGLTRFVFNLRNRHFLAMDISAFCITAAIALVFRTENPYAVMHYADSLALYVLIAGVIRFAVFYPLGLYSRYWRYASIDELIQIATGVITATFLVTLVFFGLLRPLGLIPNDFPRSVPLIDGFLILPAVGGVRYSVRLVERMSQHRRNYPENAVRVAVLGAGNAGVVIVKEMQANPQLGLEPIIFLDDDPRKRGALIHGVPVVGECRRIRDVAKDYRLQQAIIAMPTASGKTIRELAQLCQTVNISVKTVPGIFGLLDGSVTVNQLRSVDVADLLRREPVVADMTEVVHLLKGKRVLVTGAGGSIGSELCRQTARCNPALLILLGHGENSIFEIYNELQKTCHASHITCLPVIADIRDTGRMRTIFQHYQPQIVFHTAAHKHVPLMEENVEDAITNNVLGTHNLIECAADNGVEHFVLISTDKAVNPTSVMGATKRIAELLVQHAAARSGRCFVAVRFGNVLGSRGSVVPLFKQQIAQGGPVTVTHPEVRRYFLMIPEAVQLVLQAATLGKGGEIFLLEMGEPVKIIDLAHDLIRLSGLEEGQDIDIVFTGLRPGEKLFEELLVPGENYAPTRHEKIFVARNGATRPEGEDDETEASADATYRESHPAARDLSFISDVAALITAAQTGDIANTHRLLRSIVAEYRPTESVIQSSPQVSPMDQARG